jgi:hypothetical protein
MTFIAIFDAFWWRGRKPRFFLKVPISGVGLLKFNRFLSKIV